MRTGRIRTFVLLFTCFTPSNQAERPRGDVCQVSTSSWVSAKPNLVLCWPVCAGHRYSPHGILPPSPCSGSQSWAVVEASQLPGDTEKGKGKHQDGSLFRTGLSPQARVLPTLPPPLRSSWPVTCLWTWPEPRSSLGTGSCVPDEAASTRANSPMVVTGRA